MTSTAAGDGARLRPVAEYAGRRRASGIYGAIITAAILDTVGGHTSTTVLVISVVVTLLVYWIAEEYAEVLGEHTAGGRLPSRAYIRDALAALAGASPLTARQRRAGGGASPIWPGHAPRRPGTRPDMAGRQRQLVFLTRAARR